MATAHNLTGIQRTFATDELIVTKTDLSGKITYANDIFVNISGYTEDELLGSPHSMIRHPEMPRAIFKLLWDRLLAEQEIFAFVVNRCKNGDHYWVLAHVTPNFDQAGKAVGYHSSRRMPTSQALATIRPIYDELRRIEASGERKAALVSSSKALPDILAKKGFESYDRFVLALAE